MSAKRTVLPKNFNIAHDLCFAVHDILLQFLISGQQSGVFIAKFELSDSEAESLKAYEDIFDWLESAGRVVDRAQILKTNILPAVLSDMLHCIYEALQCSRKAQLNISYILVRKPLLETLFLLESYHRQRNRFRRQACDESASVEATQRGRPCRSHQTSSGRSRCNRRSDVVRC